MIELYWFSLNEAYFVRIICICVRPLDRVHSTRNVNKMCSFFKDVKQMWIDGI